MILENTNYNLHGGNMKYKLKDSTEVILKLHNDGISAKAIALQFSVSDTAIRSHLSKFGIKAHKVNKDFTEEQIIIVSQLYKERKDCLYIANQLNVTQSRIIKLFEKLGFDSSNNFFKKEDEVILRKLYEEDKKTIEYIADYFGCYRQAVDVAFNRFGIKTRNHEERKQINWYVNREAFTNWKDEHTLFYYGLLLADGCLSDNNSVSIALQKSDKHILDSFAIYMQSNNKVIKAKQDGCSFSFSFMDSVVADNLRIAGMESRKSTKETFPTVLDRNDLESCKHFWRGYICGDGSVRTYNNPSLHICGSIEICSEFKLFCEKVLGYNLDINVKEYLDERRTQTLYYFKVSGRKARDISLFMFEDSNVHINRKYEDVMKFKNWQPSPKNKAYGVYKTQSGQYKVIFYPYNGNKTVAKFDNEQEAVDYRLSLEMEYYGYYKSLS